MTEESKYTPSVSNAEIADWEKRFKEAVSPMVEFDSIEGKPSMRLYKGASGVEASWSGTITLRADNYVKWSFSIQNNPFIEAKFELDKESKTIIDSLYDFYSIWKQEWSKSLSIPPSAEEEQEGPAQLPPAPAPETATAPIQEAYNIGKDRNKQQIIDDHSDRMKKLAGLI
jgi:hypothetical protein